MVYASARIPRISAGAITLLQGKFFSTQVCKIDIKYLPKVITQITNLRTTFDFFGCLIVKTSTQYKVYNQMEDNLLFCFRQYRELNFGTQNWFNPTRWNIEENLNLFENRRPPQFFWKWKTTSFSFKSVDNLIFLKMEDNLIV